MKFQIENYDSMTTEEKLAALEAFEPDMSAYVSKTSFDKTASELAAAKKALREKQTDDEAKAAKDAEEREALIARVKELEQKEMVSTYTNSYLALGYDEKSAKASAEALAKGDIAAVFANQKAHIETREKALKAELLKETPPPAGGAPVSKTKDDILKMSLSEQVKFAAENPDEYKKIYGGN